MNEDDVVEIPVTVLLRGPAFLPKLLERALEHQLSDAVEAGFRVALDSEDVVDVWGMTIHDDKIRALPRVDR